jgi:uncharacterized delta-60 repeat protein
MGPMVSSAADRTSGSRRLAAALIGLSLCAAIMLNGLLAWAAPADRLGSGNVFSAAAPQPDGKVVAVGGTDHECGPTAEGFGCNDRAIVVRFDRHGQLDPTFGGGDGIVMPELTGNRGGPTGVLVGEGGMITISFANVLRGGEGGYSALARLHPDGSLDTSFGQGGIEVLGSPAITSMVALPGGRLLIYGTGRSNPYTADRIMRIERDGSIDPGFAFETVGKAFENAAGLEVGPDGKIYVAGNTQKGTPPDYRELAVLRFLPDGQPDPSFGKDGVARLPGPEETNPGYTTQIEDFGLEPYGRIVVSLLRPAPYRAPRSSELVRLQADGSPGGTVVAAEARTCGGKVAVEPNGDILTADVAQSDAYYGFCIQEHLPSGALVAESKLHLVASIGVMAVEPDGRVIAGGSYGATPSTSSALVSLYSIAGLDREFGLAFLPRLGCKGHNPTEAPSTEPEEGIVTPHAYGTHGRDVIVGTPEADTILGNAGADLICGGAGADRIFGGPGPDRLAGGLGHDRLFGGPGRDRIRN